MLETDIMYLKGVGPHRAKILNEVDIYTISDLLYYFPRKYVDRTVVKQVRDCELGEEVVIIGQVETFGLIRTRGRNYFQMILADGSGTLNCNWFNGLNWIVDKFHVGDKVAVFGKIEFYNGKQIVHPDFDILEQGEDPVNTNKILAIYPSTAKLKAIGLVSRGFRKLITTALDKLNNTIPDHFDDLFLRQNRLMVLNSALRIVHQPHRLENLNSALNRLKFDEHYFLQLLMALRRQALSENNGRVFERKGPFVKEMYSNLPFQLTRAQINVLREIRKDLSGPHQMNRLLQGDVGSGKTVVAMFTAAIVIGHGAQVAVMAPTEILAEQHFRNFYKYCELVGISTAILKGGMKESERSQLLEKLKNADIQLIVGTHALIQPDVKFKDLGLIIVDEQHRFGVEQRKELIQKGLRPQILAMTATPIPRTLAITFHGDMDISIIDEMPKDRIPIKTKILEPSELDPIYHFLKKEMNSGRQCFVVYPLIEESEKLDLQAAESSYKLLNDKVFPDHKLGFLHGKMKNDERDKCMQAFINNEIQLMVATTVIEVGIDIPNATLMIIDNAERFGLAQLHQLRGRIGRGKHQSYCMLVQRKETEAGKRRLSIMSQTTNGFVIADEDLKLRGPGEFFGKKQHGYMKAKLANLVEDGTIIRQARQAAFQTIRQDPHLRNRKNHRIKNHFMKNYKPMLEFVNIG